MPQTFYMTVGLPGGGKSRWAASVPDAVIHSSDAIRAELFGDENNQSDSEIVFKVLHERVLRDLSEGKNVVYDATNINYKRRMGFLNQIRSLHMRDLKKQCIFMAVPYGLCVERNKNRERYVPEDVIRRMYFNIDVPVICEGWDEIQIEDSMGYPDPRTSTLRMESTIKRLSFLKHDNPHHEYSIGDHCKAAWLYFMEHYFNDKLYDLALSRAVLLHDVGKEQTKVFTDSKGNASSIAHFYNHEKVGAYESFYYTGDLISSYRLKTAALIRWHMWPYVVDKSDNPNRTLSKAKKLFGDWTWNQVMILHECDLNAH